MRSRVGIALAAALGLLVPTAATAQRVEERFALAPERTPAVAGVEWSLDQSHARTGFIVGGTIGAFAVGALTALACLALDDGAMLDCDLGPAARAVLIGGAIGGASGGTLGFLVGALIPRQTAHDGGDS